MQHASCLEKQREIVEQLGHFKSPEELYHALIELGKRQPSLGDEQKTPANRIAGCQATAYLATEFTGGKVFFQIEADALISAGLGQLVARVYSGESPETILQCPPDCFEKIGLSGALSPTRSNGLAQMLLRCKKEALACLVSSS